MFRPAKTTTGYTPPADGAPGYTVSDGPPVVLGGSIYETQTMQYDNDLYPENVWLYGRKGGVYTLRGFTGDDNGLRQVVSVRSGAPLRVLGNEVRVTYLAGHIEQHVPAGHAPARRGHFDR